MVQLLEIVQTRRRFIRKICGAGVSLALIGCVGIPLPEYSQQLPTPPKGIAPQVAALYSALPDERFPIPEIDFNDVDTDFLRSVVGFPTREPPGTLIISTSQHTLHLVLQDGQAIRYGVGVGKDGLEWTGRAEVGRKADWPRWTPTADMIRRDPALNAKWSGGMEPGLDNPLGARALYLYRDGRDTLYRIHGTNDPASIGRSVSSGCIRMFNQDVIDLYNRVPVGSRVIVGP
jgi:lipoprotein-anchoring transpeptidase ErfK/SrfK